MENLESSLIFKCDASWFDIPEFNELGLSGGRNLN
jgi:hypothetical protein